MNNDIKMKKKNEDGVEIVKEVPAELYSNYLSMGWEVVGTKTIEKPKSTTILRDSLNAEKEDK